MKLFEKKADLPKIKVMLDDGAFVPERAYSWDAGMDLRTPESVELRAHGSAVVDTGVHVDIPQGYVGMVKSKSGLNTKHEIVSTGVVDAGFTGSIKVKLYNHGDADYTFEAGDKITQLVVMPVVTPVAEVVESLDGGSRGNNGYGSTGR